MGWALSIGVHAALLLGAASIWIEGYLPFFGAIDADGGLTPVDLPRNCSYGTVVWPGSAARGALLEAAPIDAEESEAREVIPRFLSKVDAVKARPDENREKIEELVDECHGLSRIYGGTTFGARLREIEDDLLNGPLAPSRWEEHIVPLQSEVRATAKRGDFAYARRVVDEFGEVYREKNSVQLACKLNEQRDFLKRESRAYVFRQIAQAKKDLAADATVKQEIRKRLRDFLPGLDPYQEAREKLETFLAEME